MTGASSPGGCAPKSRRERWALGAYATAPISSGHLGASSPGGAPKRHDEAADQVASQEATVVESGEAQGAAK